MQKEKADRYEVVGKLGEGGFGLVFVVLDKRDFRQYVLKEVRNSSSFCSWASVHTSFFASLHKVCCVNEEEAKDAMREVRIIFSLGNHVAVLDSL